ncbi:MAG: T9SS type A sorting domain-containing protein, partial [Ignavibacteriales bacterium]|nr:T9SS type A sorting domain-containing protein [Ignavibacteriales bacterium]
YNLALLINEWITTTPTFGTVAPGSSQEITTKISAKSLTGGDYIGQIRINNNDPVRNPKNVHVSLHVIGKPVLKVFPDSLVGFIAYTGITRRDTLRIKNTGTEKLIVSDVAASDTVLKLNKKNFSLNPGAEEKLIVTFTVHDTGTFSQQLTFTSNDSGKLSMKYPIRGTIAYPSEISVSSDSLLFTLMERDSAFTTLTIHNNGMGVLNWKFEQTTTLPESEQVFNFESFFSRGSKWQRGSGNSVFKSSGTSDSPYKEKIEVKKISAKSTDGLQDAAIEMFPLFGTTSSGVHRIHPTTGAIVESYPLPLSGGPDGIAFDGKWVYVLKGYTNIVYRFSTNPLQFIDTLVLSISPNIDGLGTDGTLLYVSDYFLPRIYAIDIQSRMLIATLFPDTSLGGGVTFAGRRNSIFASNFPNRIYEFNAKSGATIRSFQTPNNSYVYGLAYSGSADVLIASGSGLTYLVNPNTGVIISSYSGNYTGLAADEALINYLTMHPSSGIVKSMLALSTNDPLNPVTDIFTGITVTEDPNSVETDVVVIPTVFALHQNYPNPFNPMTTIRYDIPKQSQVKITVYNILGKEVKTIVSENQSPGFYSIVWNGQSRFGAAASGVYFASIRAGDFAKTIKMVLLK